MDLSSVWARAAWHSGLLAIDGPSVVNQHGRVGLWNHAQRWWHVASRTETDHDDVIKWKHFPRYWPFVRGIHRSPVNSPHKGQRRGALIFSLICVWINGWVNNREAGDLRRYRAHYDVSVMLHHLCVHCSQFVLPIKVMDLEPALQWRHIERDVVSNHRRLGCLPSLLLGADQR